MNKILKLDFISDEDMWGVTTSESVSGISDKGTKISYYVHDLAEYPEDAILGRDLFSGWDYIDALLLGLKLAAEGYTGIEVIEHKDNE